MLILTNCLTDTVDEGALKVANSLVKRIKASSDEVKVLSYDREHILSDKHLKLNKLMLNKQLISEIRKSRSDLLYIPFPAKTLPTAIRIFILSLYKRGNMNTVLVMKGKYSFFAKLFLRLSRSNIIALSKESAEYYKQILSEKRVKYIKAGVDTKRFVPAAKQEQSELKLKYGLDKDRPVVLHVGHLKYGRNVQKLADIDKQYQVLLVCSTLTENERDEDLKQRLSSCDNIRIIDSYIPCIEEIYKLSDIYFFPTYASSNCIDVPLSVLEAASCDKPVVATKFGELKEFVNKEGFYFINYIH